MGVVQLPDDLQRIIDQQIASGRAITPLAFVEEAVLSLVDEAGAEENELRQAVESGSADIDAGRYTTVATPDDEQDLHDGIMARLRARLFGLFVSTSKIPFGLFVTKDDVTAVI